MPKSIRKLETDVKWCGMITFPNILPFFSFSPSLSLPLSSVCSFSLHFLGREWKRIWPYFFLVASISYGAVSKLFSCSLQLVIYYVLKWILVSDLVYIDFLESTVQQYEFIGEHEINTHRHLHIYKQKTHTHRKKNWGRANKKGKTNCEIINLLVVDCAKKKSDSLFLCFPHTNLLKNTWNRSGSMLQIRASYNILLFDFNISGYESSFGLGKTTQTLTRNTLKFTFHINWNDFHEILYWEGVCVQTRERERERKELNRWRQSNESYWFEYFNGIVGICSAQYLDSHNFR